MRPLQNKVQATKEEFNAEAQRDRGAETSMNEIVLIVGMALVTFVVRYPVLALVGKIPLPDGVLRALRYVPPAVLAAIILPAMIYDGNGAAAISVENTYLVAGIVSFVVAWWTKNTLITIVVGMALLLGLKAALGQF